MRYIVKYSLDLYQDGLGLVAWSCFHLYSRPFKEERDAIALQQTLLDKASRKELFAVITYRNNDRDAEYFAFGPDVTIIECSKKGAKKYDPLLMYVDENMFG